LVPGVFAASIGSGIGVDITTEKFKPLVFMCYQRVMLDDATEPGRISPDGLPLVERINIYAFEGEQLHWLVLVMDKNGIEKVKDVFATIGATQGAGNDIEVNCQRISGGQQVGASVPPVDPSCNAKIGEEPITQFDSNTMAYYDCTLTVETPASMHEEYFITVEAKDATGLSGTMAENEYWFLNPTIALSVDGDLTFDNVRPGTDAYSQTLLVGNDAEAGSGVILDMFMSGTNFYDPDSSGARCPTTNELNLDNFRYFATNGAYSTQNDLQNDNGDFVTVRKKDVEGYVNIQNTMEGFSTKMYNEAEIIQSGKIGPYYAANTLSPGSEMALTFKLSMPEPCVGDFSEGQIYFWGEAI
jgi:hypothetical protein